jgi:uncharacterized protein (TIGR03437 family)
MRLQLRLNLRRLVLALIALLSFGAILLKQSDGYLRASAAVQTVVSVNAASYEKGPLARGSLASVFGNNLATRTEKSQDATAKTKLGDVTVQLTGSDNVTRAAELVMVSPQQINFVIPDGSPLGKTLMVIKDGEKDTATGEFQVADASPALFTSDSGDGKSKLAVGMASANGSANQSIVNSDGIPSMIGPGAPWAPTTVTLLGTGIRYASDVQVRIGDQVVATTFVEKDDERPGVDRVTFRMPRMSRAGMNTLSLVVNTRSSATASSGATTLAAGAAQSSDTTMTSNAAQVNALGPAAPSPFVLSADDVRLIIAQAVAKAQQLGVAATIAVVDKEGNVLGIFKMNGARSDVLLGRTDLRTGQPSPGSLFPDPDGLQSVRLPLASGLGLLSDGAALAAISKAGTAAFFSTQGSSISTRTASFIIGENFPRNVSSQSSGPLYGVQFSSLPCSDFRGNVGLATLPLGLSGDSGGFGLYKNGVAVGGVSAELDGFYTVDLNITDREVLPEEQIGMAATRGYRPPPAITADNILIDGMRFAFSNVQPGGEPPAAPYASLVGPVGSELVPPTGQFVSRYTPLMLGGVPGRVIPDPNPGNPSNIGRQGYFPFKNSQVSSLTANDVNIIITQAAQQAYRTRAAIRLPVGPNTLEEVNITVVDTSGAVLGVFSTQDAPEFGFDVSAQKARTVVFFSLPTAAAMLLAADANIKNVPGLSVSKYAGQAAAFGVPLNGQFAFSSRAMGFLARSFFPDGIVGTPNGPFSKPLVFWSEFNDGLQIAAVKPALVSILTGGAPANLGCSPLPNDLTLADGFQIFAGSGALYKNGVLVGGIGISGGGIDQDDIISAGGSFGYDPPANVRADQLLPMGVRLPYRKYPRHPNIVSSPPNPPIIRNTRAFSNTN